MVSLVWSRACAVIFGTALVAWEPSTRIEVYSLAAACSLFAIARTLNTKPDMLAYALAALAGCCNPVGGAIAVGTLLTLHALELRRGKVVWRQEFRSLLGGLFGALALAYLPLRAFFRGGPPTVYWGGLHDTDSWKRFLSGADYALGGGVTFKQFGQNAFAFIVRLHKDGGTWPWVLAFLALPLLANARQAALPGVGHSLAVRPIVQARVALAMLSVLGVAFIASNRIFLIDNPDYLGYVLPAFWLAVGAAATTAPAILGFKYENTRPALRFGFLGAMTVAVAFSALAPFPGPFNRSRSSDRSARMAAEALLRVAPKGAIILVGGDHVAAPMMYLQYVEHQRPDVVVLATGLASAGWYWKSVYRLHPDLERFSLRGPGRQLGRLRRLQAAAPNRVWLAHRLDDLTPMRRESTGDDVCPVPFGWRLGTESCDDVGPRETIANLQRERARVRVGCGLLSLEDDCVGSPTAGEGLAQIADDVGWDLLRVGAYKPAFRVWMAASGMPPGAADEVDLLPHPRHRFARPLFETRLSLGDERRNTLYAALLCQSADRDDLGMTFIQSALRRARASGLGSRLTTRSVSH